MTGGRENSAVTVATILAAGAKTGAKCQITFTLAPDEGGADSYRAAYVDTEANRLVFAGDRTESLVRPGPHVLVWAVSGQPGEPFSFRLTGDIDRERAERGEIPPGGVTTGAIDFVAERNP
ncbi:MAG: hypothetical protein ACJ79S_10515 [Gemmatimonadaceae bacterium]